MRELMGGVPHIDPRLDLALICCVCVHSQAMNRTGAELASLRLDALKGKSRAYLDGFRSRNASVKMSSQRNLYASEWRALDMPSVLGVTLLVIGAESAGFKPVETYGGEWAGRRPGCLATASTLPMR